MKITNFDTDILLALISEGEATTTSLAKWLVRPRDDYDLRKADSKIRYRLERMLEKDMVRKQGKMYVVNEERVFLTSAAMHLHEIEVDVPMGQMLVVYPKGGRIMMRTISVEQMKRNGPR